MEVNTGYKRTEVGVIPEDWSEVLLDRIAKRGSGHTPDKKHPEYWNGDIKWISLADSPALDRLYIDDTFAKVTAKGIANSSAVIHPAGTVVLSRDAGVGKSAIMLTDMAVSQHFMAWRCGPDLNNRFLYYWLQSVKQEFERIANGSTIKTIGLAYFKALKVPQPPLYEQVAIATALSDADALLAALDRLIAKKRDLKQAAMQQLLTGQTRLTGFHGEWKVKQLGDVVEKVVGGGTPSRGNRAFWGNEIPWATVKDFATFNPRQTQEFITMVGLKNSASNLIPAGTLITSTRMALGKSVIYEVDVAINQDLKALFLKPGTSHIFVYYWFEANAQVIDDLGSGSTVKGISIAQLKAIPFPNISLSEQAVIAEALSDMDTELAGLEQRREKTRALKQGMMQELLTGKTRLISLKESHA